MLAFAMLLWLTCVQIKGKHYLVKTKEKEPESVKGVGYQSFTGVDYQSSGTKGGPVTVKDESGKCKFTCRKNGGCQVKWVNYENDRHGEGYCHPLSREGGRCNLGSRAPALCQDCHGARERAGKRGLTGGSCEAVAEPEKVECNYFCEKEQFCKVHFKKTQSNGEGSEGTYPHDDKKNLPEKCHDKCLKEHPECGRSAKQGKSGVTCDYFCHKNGQTCMVKWTKSDSSGSSSGVSQHYKKDKLPEECHDKCEKEVPDCGF